MAARGQCVADLAGDRRLRHPVERLLVGEVARREPAVRRPRDGHRALALHERRKVLDEAELLDARRHEAVLGAPSFEDLHADRRVDRRLHRVAVEEAAALVAEAFLEEEVAVAGFAEHRGTVSALRLQLLGEERADLVELLPGLGRREFVLVLRLEGLLQRGVGEDVLAVVHDEHVTVVGEAVDLPVDRHLVVAVRRRDVLQFGAVLVLVDERVERLERAGLHEVGHPRGDDVQRVVRTGAGAVFLHDLREHLGRRDFDDLHLAARQLFPHRTREVLRIEGLQAGFPDDRDRLAAGAKRLGCIDRGLRGAGRGCSAGTQQHSRGSDGQQRETDGRSHPTQRGYVAHFGDSSRILFVWRGSSPCVAAQRLHRSPNRRGIIGRACSGGKETLAVNRVHDRDDRCRARRRRREPCGSRRRAVRSTHS